MVFGLDGEAPAVEASRPTIRGKIGAHDLVPPVKQQFQRIGLGKPERAHEAI